jgi:hypothetical protein
MAGEEYMTGLTGAASGAGVGALAGGPVGAGIGAGIGGLSGVLGGIGAGRRESAQQAALRRYQAALAAYGGQMGDISGQAFQQGRGLEQTWQGGMSDFLAKYPDMAKQLQDLYGQGAAGAEAAGASAWKPMAGGGYGRAIQERLRGEAQQGAQASYLPGVLQGAYGDAGLQEQGQRFQTQRLGMQRGRGAGQLADLTALQQALAYEPLAQAQARLQAQMQQAQTAGSGYTLAGGLLGAGGNLAAGMAMMGSRPTSRPMVPLSAAQTQQIGTNMGTAMYPSMAGSGLP